MSIKFLVLGGGGILGFGGGGGKCRFYFYGRGDFSEGVSGCDLSRHLQEPGRAKGGGGQNSRARGQNPARMARRKPFLETLRKLFLGGHLREILGVCMGLHKRNGIGVGKRTEVRGISETVSLEGLLVPPPPPLFCAPPPLWRFLE